jgi:hypothetical protein
MDMIRFNKDLKVNYNNQINQSIISQILISLMIKYNQDGKFLLLITKLMVWVQLILIKANL